MQYTTYIGSALFCFVKTWWYCDDESIHLCIPQSLAEEIDSLFMGAWCMIFFVMTNACNVAVGVAWSNFHYMLWAMSNFFI